MFAHWRSQFGRLLSKLKHTCTDSVCVTSTRAGASKLTHMHKGRMWRNEETGLKNKRDHFRLHVSLTLYFLTNLCVSVHACAPAIECVCVSVCVSSLYLLGTHSSFVLDSLQRAAC